MLLHVLVPTLDTDLFARGSAIVGPIDRNYSRLVCYFEGDIYNTGMSWEEKLLHASDRLTQRYPTVARALMVMGVEVKAVGTYDTDTQRLTVTDQEALDEWRKDA